MTKPGIELSFKLFSKCICLWVHHGQPTIFRVPDKYTSLSVTIQEFNHTFNPEYVFILEKDCMRV